MFVLLLIVILGLAFYHFYTHYGRRGKMINKLPGPKIIPLLGNSHLFQGSPADVWNVIRKLNKQYSRLWRVWLGHYPTVNLYHPDDAEILLSSMKYIEKSKEYDFLHPWLKTGLLTSTGKKWQTRRKMLTPAFHFSVLKEFLDIFDEHSKILVEHLKSHGDESVHDIVPIFTKYTLNTICETAMGTSLHDSDTQDDTYRNALHHLVEILYYRAFRPWLAADWIFNLFSKGGLFNQYLMMLHKFSTNIINERKEFHEQTGDRHLKSIISSDTSTNIAYDGIKSRKKRMAMLDHLIAAQKFGDQIDDDGIREEVDTFIFEGHDTTSMGMCFVLLMLSEHKEIQDQAREEVDMVLNEMNDKIGTAEIQQLNYLEQCIKETLRLYPSVPLISRHLHTDLQLENYLIPAGCSADLHIYDLHRNPNFWPDPEKFDPDRFSPDRSQKRHPYSFVPFSAGPRNCIGQKFAMMELKTYMAHILHKFILEPVDYSKDIIINSDLVIRPAVPIRVKFTARVK
ncbi:cytochrome P450 4C1-like [Leptopilina boulardi]|uniref:cytochrome P450 4C1-like n=1 Tax=Leptopilina boulardi TaxID=63433 RepID=UPI0021F529A6|nr:cytochrome P450 4C1-like [Leptopilina boulardi]